jgi:glycosyltransferase involved in cell wall biosynthesis
VIYNAHDLVSGFRQKDGVAGALGRQRLRVFERRLLASVAETWLPSRAELGGAAELAPAARLRYVPNALDVVAITPVGKRPPSGRALMVADFTYLPNREGLRFLVREVVPRVWRDLPSARLALVGRGLEAPPTEDHRVVASGFVEDLGAEYAAADCALVPLLRGGGSPLKFIEALAYGVPVVATPQAAAGLDVEPSVHYLEGATPEAFASAVVRVLREGAPDLAVRGRELAEREHSIEALARTVAR